eukprot:436836-Hanusia_phi.AAC.1
MLRTSELHTFITLHKPSFTQRFIKPYEQEHQNGRYSKARILKNAAARCIQHFYRAFGIRAMARTLHRMLAEENLTGKHRPIAISHTRVNILFMTRFLSRLKKERFISEISRRQATVLLRAGIARVLSVQGMSEERTSFVQHSQAFWQTLKMVIDTLANSNETCTYNVRIDQFLVQCIRVEYKTASRRILTFWKRNSLRSCATTLLLLLEAKKSGSHICEATMKRLLVRFVWGVTAKTSQRFPRGKNRSTNNVALPYPSRRQQLSWSTREVRINCVDTARHPPTPVDLDF